MSWSVVATSQQVFVSCFYSSCLPFLFDIISAGEALVLPTSTVADPAMGGSGGRPLPHWPKLRAVRGCAKQSASDTRASFHLNP